MSHNLNIKVPIDIDLTELKKLLSLATTQVEQLQDTIDEIKHYQLHTKIRQEAIT